MVDSRSERLLRIAGVLFVAAALFFLGALAQHFLVEGNPRPWNPLGPYPVQHVVNPARVPLNGFVIVEGRKCARETVQITSIQRWRTPSRSIKTGEGAGIQQAGCTSFTVRAGTAFYNFVPRSVQKAQLQLCAARLPTEPWQIAAEVTPHKDGRTGGTIVWTTEPFTLAC